MGGRWNLFGFYMHKVLLVVIMFQLQSKVSLALNLEGMALLKVRSKVEVDPYGALVNWDPKHDDPCNWSGVLCIDGKVETLDLKNLSLGGTLASELAELSNLKALILHKNNFSGIIPKEIGRLKKLEVLDLRGNNFTGTIPTEIGELLSLKHLLLSGGEFHEGLNVRSDTELQSGTNYINRKIRHCVWQTGLEQLKKAKRFISIPLKDKLQKFHDMLVLFKYQNSSDGQMKHGSNLPNSSELHIIHNFNGEGKFIRRRLLEETRNLPAAPVSTNLPLDAVSVPSTGSGSFPAISNGDVKQFPKLRVPEDLLPTFSSMPELHPGPSKPTDSVAPEPTVAQRLGHGSYLFVLFLIVLLVAITLSLVLRHQHGAAMIGPWKTGLSGELQKALITGATTLNRLELESACEDFSNIIATFPEYTVFKGTLSSGIEIAVASTVIKSVKDWSKHSQTHFRRKIDTLSRINHKNFLNLLGYCEENDPFMRMMVLEYAPNGSIHDHLHVKDYEHLDWSARVRIIMGTAYCLQYMHHELKPPVFHPDLQASSILLTDDFAAKVVDTSVWKEVIRKKGSRDYDSDFSESTFADLRSNVYDFGILLLEIISGKLSYTNEHDCLLKWAEQYLSKNKMKALVDPTLKSFKEDELEIICEVIQDCTRDDPKKRPVMKAITNKLQDVIPISPEAASPRFSPLWWAELEILSVEAS